jgi:hypothetical protein
MNHDNSWTKRYGAYHTSHSAATILQEPTNRNPLTESEVGARGLANHNRQCSRGHMLKRHAPHRQAWIVRRLFAVPSLCIQQHIATYSTTQITAGAKLATFGKLLLLLLSRTEPHVKQHSRTCMCSWHLGSQPSTRAHAERHVAISARLSCLLSSLLVTSSNRSHGRGSSRRSTGRCCSRSAVAVFRSAMARVCRRSPMATDSACQAPCIATSSHRATALRVGAADLQRHSMCTPTTALNTLHLLQLPSQLSAQQLTSQ